MRCMKCGKPSYKSTTSETIELGDSRMLIQNIPCYKCEECDEVYYTGDVALRIEDVIQEVPRPMQNNRVITLSNGSS